MIFRNAEDGVPYKGIVLILSVSRGRTQFAPTVLPMIYAVSLKKLQLSVWAPLAKELPVGLRIGKVQINNNYYY